MTNAHEQKLEHIISRMQSDRSVDAPSDVLKHAKNLFKTRAAEPSLIQRIVAVLKVDLAPNRAAFGERSAGGGAARQMLFDSGENAIDLRITSVDGGFDIRGQVLGDGFNKGSVSLGSYVSDIDEFGGFKFNAIVVGEYDLTVRGEASEIVVEKIVLK